MAVEVEVEPITLDDLGGPGMSEIPPPPPDEPVLLTATAALCDVVAELQGIGGETAHDARRRAPSPQRHTPWAERERSALDQVDPGIGPFPQRGEIGVEHSLLR
jgi:hypothetical protein